jgi:hypothetical protein
MPTGPSEDDPWKSKRKYVVNRLLTLRGEALDDMVRAVATEFGDAELAGLVAPIGLVGVAGEPKNLIFAADGAKPRIVLRDAINNTIEIVENADKCLIYDRHIGATGLTWADLTHWWAARDPVEPTPARSLFRRLRDSLASPPERVLFNAYGSLYGQAQGDELPALLPQVYLHYDPYTARELVDQDGGALMRQRMDFLLLLPRGRRIVVEVDGKQHYAEGDRASPRRYAEMVSEDRRLRLAGYEVYRFGGAELPDSPRARELVLRFFEDLLATARQEPTADR